MNFAVVGAGFSGTIIANELAKSGHSIFLFESRNHIGGNCYTERDSQTGINVHKYGPHIFHTDIKSVWDYVNDLTVFVPYINRVKLTSNGCVYSMPINLHTINQYFKKTFNPADAKKFVESLSISTIIEPNSFEEQALKFVGKDIYEVFFKNYTVKQWGRNPKELPASILKRLPIRFNYDDNYFVHKYQGMPLNGYTPIFEKLLDHPNIKLLISTLFNPKDQNLFDHVFFTGPLDSWFNYSEGNLSYRTLDFKKEYHNGDYQGCAVMNYPDIDIPFTRITEHKHFSPWESFDDTVIFKEYSRECGSDDIPYYPIRLESEKKILRNYIKKCQTQKKVSFLGRLGTYRYIDMDLTIHEALLASKSIINSINKKDSIPIFFLDVNP